MMVNETNKNLVDLYDVKCKVYLYYNEKGTIVKTIREAVEKKFIKQIKKIGYDEQIQNDCLII